MAEDDGSDDAPLPPLPQIEAPLEEENNSLSDAVILHDHDKSLDKQKMFSRFANYLEISGYARMLFGFYHNAHLGTYVSNMGGTSNFGPGLGMFLPKKDLEEGEKDKNQNPNVNHFSTNMRFRLKPTVHILDNMRIRSTFDFLDNVVLGSNPDRAGNRHTFMTNSQSPANAIKLKNIFAESELAIGDLRFGRMPHHFGLGILYNSGEGLSDIYGDQIDGVFFSTRLGDPYLTLGYNVAYAGPVIERFPIDSGSLTHVFSLSLLKRDGDFIRKKKFDEKRSIFDYGAHASYRYQRLDTDWHLEEKDLSVLGRNTIRRSAHVGSLSLWSAFSSGTFHLEAEADGIIGKYDSNSYFAKWGAALESKYGFLDDRLQLGLNGGIASAHGQDSFIFNRAYQVDLLLHREVLGGIKGSAYAKTHLSYYFTENFGVKGDGIFAWALDREMTKGKSSLLGIELDASGFIRTDSGVYFSLSYGALFPLKGLSWDKSALSSADHHIFGTAKTAHTLQAFLAMVF